jgi:hypothetical protein
MQSASIVDVFDPSVDLRAGYRLDFPMRAEPAFRLSISPRMLPVLAAEARRFARRRPVGTEFFPPAVNSAAPWGYARCVACLPSQPGTEWSSFALLLPGNGVYGIAEVLSTIDVIARVFAYARAPWESVSLQAYEKQPVILRSIVLPRLESSSGGVDLRVCPPFQSWLKMHGERGEAIAVAAMRRAWEFTAPTSSTRSRGQPVGAREHMSCSVDCERGLLRALAVPGAQAIGGLHVPPGCDDEIRANRGYDMESTNLTSERKILTALAGFCALWGAASSVPLHD